ncbi:hypothetical protein HG531_013841 [Fusarium graminearum]|nr:hypothetical protein HG531_013841 [Fusarium graminearum]
MPTPRPPPTSQRCPSSNSSIAVLAAATCPPIRNDAASGRCRRKKPKAVQADRRIGCTAYSLGIARSQADARLVSNNDTIHEFTKDDDEECTHAVNLVRNIHGRAVSQIQLSLDPGAQSKRPCCFLVEYSHGNNGGFCADTDILQEEGDGDDQTDKHETSHDSSLSTMLIRCERGDKEDSERSEARNKIRSNSRAHRCDVHIRIVGIVSIQYKKGHDPKNNQAL